MGEEKARAKKQKESEEAEMRDRLIKLLETDVECNKDGHGDCSMCEYKYADDKCAHYLSAIIADFFLASGVIVPPCKVGDTVYRLKKRRGIWEVLPREVVSITHRLDHLYRLVWEIFTTEQDRLGKTVFLTKELAEKALERSRE